MKTVIIIITSLLSLKAEAIGFRRYDSSECQTPNKLSVQNLIELPESRTPSFHTMPQGEYGSCYAMAVKNMLDSYSGETVSVMDLLKKFGNSNLERARGGIITTLLKKVQLDDYEILSDSYDSNSKTWDYSRIVNTADYKIVQAELMRGNLKPLKKWIQAGVMPDILKYIEESPSHKRKIYKELRKCKRNDRSTCVLETLFNENALKTLELQRYDIYSWFPTNENESITEKIKALITEGAMIGLSTMTHAVNITGHREVCCGESCHGEFKVLDSGQEDQTQNNWFLSESVLQDKGFSEIAWIKKCDAPGCDAEIETPEGYSQPTNAYAATRTGDVKWLEEKIESAEIQLKPEGSLLLQEAIDYDQVEVVKMLEKHGAGYTPIPLQDDSKWSALHLAARHGSRQVLKYFLEEKKMNPNIRMNESEFSKTAVMEAAYSSNLANSDILMLLKKNDGNLKAIPNKSALGLLRNAVSNSRAQVDTVRYLLDQGFDPNEISDTGGLMLNSAVLYGFIENRIEIIKLLCAYGADAELEDSKGISAIERAEELYKETPHDEVLNFVKYECKKGKALKKQLSQLTGK